MDVEPLSEWLSQAGAVAVSAADAGDRPILEPDPERTPLWAHVRLDALFPPAQDTDALRVALSRRFAEQGRAMPALEIAAIADQDWSSTWRQGLTEQSYRGGRLRVVPRDAPAGDGAVLRLDPGLAFGTGSHPTTALCLDWLAGQDVSGWRVLDYGCGSGILGIAARLLGAAAVTAVDHDVQALRSTRDNARVNGVPDVCLRVMAPGPALAATDPHDLVIANILANPLISLASALTEALKPGGWLVLSGILEDQWAGVADAYPEIDFEVPQQNDGWIRLCGRRRQRNETDDGHG